MRETNPEANNTTGETTLQGAEEKSDRLVQAGLIVAFFVGLVLAGQNQTWTLAIGLGGLSVALFLAARFALQQYNIHQYVASAAFAVFTGLFIYQTQGSFEAHFFALIGSALLITYQNWRAQVPLLLLLLIHHSWFGSMQNSGVEGIYFLPEAAFTGAAFASITVVLVVAVLINGYWMFQQESRSKKGEDAQNRLGRQLKNMENNIAFAEEISKGNLDTEYEVESDDLMGHSLNNMRVGLKKASEREEQEKFTNLGLAEIGEILRNNMNDMTMLTDLIIAKLVKYLEANQGGLFLIKEEGEDKYFSMEACYAYDRKKFLNKRFELTEGLIGAAYLENNVVFMTEVPEDYISIKSGLGDANPRSILIVPLMSNEEIVGVMELASFKVIQEYQIEFVKRAAESIASTIISAKINERTNRLLEETRQMTEEMQAQEEEMRQNMEEMQATQEEMRRAQEAIREQQSNLNALINNTDDTIFAMDTNYKITVINETLQKKYENSGIDLKVGNNILDVLPADIRQKWKDRYDRALAGEAYMETETSTSQGEERYYETYHNPIYNEYGDVIGVSVTSKDVSERVNNRKEIEKKGSVLSSLIDSSEDTFFAMDRDFIVTVVNKTLKKKYEGTVDEVFVGKDVLKSMNPERAKVWKERYNKVLSGEKLEEEIEQKLDDGTSVYMEAQGNPIYNDNGEIIGLSIIGRNITQQVLARKKVEERESLLRNLVNITGDTYFAVDRDYRITVINKVLKDRFNEEGKTLEEGDYIFDKIPQEIHSKWKMIYDRAFAGESFSDKHEREVDGKTLYVEAYYNPVKDANGEVIGASVVSKDVTEWKSLLDEKQNEIERIMNAADSKE